MDSDQLNADKSKREGQPSALREPLPQTFVWANDSGSFEYQGLFLKALLELPEHEQGQVIRQLWALGRYGPWLHSLNTKKYRIAMRYSPPGCMVSRVSKGLRFTWYKQGGRLVVCWLCRRGEI